MKQKVEKLIFKMAWKLGYSKLFVWLVHKHWIFPEPQVFSNAKYISELAQMKGNRDFTQEVMRMLADECSRTIFENWQKHNYFVFEPIEVTTRRSFENGSFEIRYKFVSKFTHGIGINDILFLAEQLKMLSDFK